MKCPIKHIFLSILSSFCILWSASIFAQVQKTAVLLDVKGAISPASQDFVEQGLQQASKQHAEVVILQIDTPGGLDKAMRGIVSSIIASPIPVITYVAPSGARAASAGTFILYASHIAAMAPGTNLGAATPISIGAAESAVEKKSKTQSIEEKKVANDAMAYIRSLAQLRGRNVQWAEQAVREGASLSANEALKLKVIDLIANDVSDLLTKINGRVVTIQSKVQELDTTHLNIVKIEPNWREKFLNIITDPSVAYILMMIGIWGLFFEFFNPGFVLPGVIGAISLLLALYAFQLLPINYAGLGLILIGIGFMIAEVFLATFGILGIGGIVAFLFGSILLMDASASGLHVALPLILAMTLVTALFFLVIISLAIKSRFRPVVSGREELIGSTGEVIANEQGLMRVRIRGEIWQARSQSALTEGQKIKVIGIDGLILMVEPWSQ